MVKLLFLKQIKNKLRTIEAQIVQKLKNNEAQPKFTGSYKKKACSVHIAISALSQPLLSQRCHNHCYPSAVTVSAVALLSAAAQSQRCARFRCYNAVHIGV